MNHSAVCMFFWFVFCVFSNCFGIFFSLLLFSSFGRDTKTNFKAAENRVRSRVKAAAAATTNGRNLIEKKNTEKKLIQISQSTHRQIGVRCLVWEPSFGIKIKIKRKRNLKFKIERKHASQQPTISEYVFFFCFVFANCMRNIRVNTLDWQKINDQKANEKNKNIEWMLTGRWSPNRIIGLNWIGWRGEKAAKANYPFSETTKSKHKFQEKRENKIHSENLYWTVPLCGFNDNIKFESIQRQAKGQRDCLNKRCSIQRCVFMWKRIQFYYIFSRCPSIAANQLTHTHTFFCAFSGM